MTELSTAEAAVVARFEAAADAEESLRERVARAIAASDRVIWDDYLTGELDLRSDYLANADAAIAVLRGE